MISRKVLVLALFPVLITSISLAQPWVPALFENLSNSAIISGSDIYFNVDIVDTISFFRGGVTTECFYSTDLQSSWQSFPMSPLGTTGYEYTWEGQQAISGPNYLIYYLRAKDDSAYVTGSPKNVDDLFPPTDNLLAEMADEPAGDAQYTTKDFLDLTGFWMSYSDSKLYVKLTNDSDRWPFNGGFLGPWYFYEAQISNPDVNPLKVYSLMYCQLEPLVTPGLYKIDGTDTTMTRLGDTEVYESGNTLIMSCNLADLVADPDFGPWPPVCGDVIPISATLTVTLTGGDLNDFTNICQYFPNTYVREFGENLAPQLVDPGVEFICSPDQSGRLFVTYLDADNNLPPSKTLYLDGVPYGTCSFDHTYDDSALFQYELSNLGTDWHFYYFEFSDGDQMVSTPPDSFRWSPVTVNLTPQDPPIVIPSQGGHFRFDVTLTNNTTSAQLFDGWTDATLPNGNPYGPILLRQGVRLNACQTRTYRNIRQNVPGVAPAGEYSYNGYVGGYPDEVWHESSFGFTKSAGEGSPFVSDWIASGWPGAESGKLVMETAPSQFELGRNFPNPFNTQTTISYSVPEPSRVTISVYNTFGQKVRTLVDSYQEAGAKSIVWNGTDDYGRPVATGLYFCRMEAGDFVKCSRMTLLK
jgi:hypothetical protein